MTSIKYFLAIAIVALIYKTGNAQLATLSLSRYIEGNTYQLDDDYSYEAIAVPSWGTKMELSYQIIRQDFALTYECGIGKQQINEINNPFISISQYERVELVNYIGFEYRPALSEKWKLRLRGGIGGSNRISFNYRSNDISNDIGSSFAPGFKAQALFQLRTSSKTAFSFGPHYSYRQDEGEILNSTNSFGLTLQFDFLIVK